MAENATGKSRFALPGTLIVLAAFAISRILYWYAGLRFDAGPVDKYWQFIDPVLMKTRLMESLFYLHMQPPGFNLAVGLTVKLFPNLYPAVLQAIYLIIGIALAFSLLHIMRLMRVSEPVAVVLTVLFIVNPGCAMYENFAIYEYPIAILLMFAAIALFRLCQQPVVWRSLLFFGLLFGLAMIRNIFHVLFLAAIAAALWFLLPKARRVVVAGALPFLALILALQTKNWILFDSFTTSTWAGMNTGVVTTFQLTPDEARKLIDSGVLSPIAAIPPFSDLNLYSPFIHPVASRGIPVLDQAATSTGHPNFNDLGYLQVHKLYISSASAVLVHFPSAYARSVAIAWFSYFLPTSDLHSFDLLRPKLDPFDRLYSEVVFGQFRQAGSRKDLRAIRATEGVLPLVLYTGVFLMAGLPLLTVWTLLQFLPKRRGRWNVEQRIVLGFLIFTIVFSTGVSNFLSTFENNRYRFPLDGYYTAIAGLAITRVMRRGAHGKLRT